MISWIQRSFQQHFKWLFLALLAVVIVSFVFITNASSGLGHNARQAPARPFFGINLSSSEETRRLYNDAGLSVELHRMQMRDESQFEQYALQRQAALHLATELNLPAPSDADKVRHIQSLRFFQGPDGAFDAKRYVDFQDSLDTNPRIKEADVARVLAHDVTYQQVLKLVSGPGYVLPIDVRNHLIRADATWSLEAATLDYATFNPDIPVTDEALSEYFEYNADRYEIASRVDAAYIDFPASAYADQVTVTEDDLRAFYEANPARFPAPDTAASPSPTVSDPSPDAAFAAVRAQVETAFKLERAPSLAMKAASDFTVSLYKNNVALDAFESHLSSRGLTLKDLAPFNHDNVPAELGSDPRVAATALKLRAAQPYSDPVNTGRGAAVLVWQNTLPASQPELAAVKDRVTADYLETEKRKRFAEAGRAVRTAIEARLKAGDSFALATSSSATDVAAKVSTTSWPAFTLSNPPRDLHYSAYNAIDGLEKGGLSQMILSGDQGLILYVADKQLPEIDPASPKFAQMRDRLASFTASRNGSAVLAALVDAELAKSAPSDQ